MSRPKLPDPEELLALAVDALGGERRDGQLRMTGAVARAMSEGRGEPLLVQAGTGTGKSLAYLVPAIWHTLGAEVRDGEPARPVIVATATIALQRQLIERDLPRLVEALSPHLPRRPTYAILKGRRNYACRMRAVGGPSGQEDLFDDGIDDSSGGGRWSPFTDLGREIMRITRWLDRTTTGDRDELLPGVSDRAWAQFSVTARECLGSAVCPRAGECFSEQARQRAGSVDIVVTNHAMLAVDVLGEIPVLPEHDVVVVDEAHELIDRVTGAATLELSAASVGRAAARGRRWAASAATRLEAAGEALAATTESLTVGRLTELPEKLATALAGVRDAARTLAEQVRTTGEADPVRRRARVAAEDLFEVTERLLAWNEGDVVWLERQSRGEILRVAPLDVAPVLAAALFSRRTAVLTSATLTVGGSFEPLARRLGLAGRYRSLDVGSPFSYRRQAILYVARHLPPPSRDGIAPEALEELVALVDAAGGRTLGLFSSMRAAQEAAEFARRRVDFPVLCQGDDATAALIERFATEPETCLFGTLSLWQGVDVPGEACQLVIVDRIPFPRPDDPITAARQEAANRAGGNGFLAVAATQAALLLAQGCGRLLRRHTDRGVVAVLDSRLATARYSNFLRASLPPFWYTTDADQVRRSLRALRAAQS